MGNEVNGKDIRRTSIIALVAALLLLCACANKASSPASTEEDAAERSTSTDTRVGGQPAELAKTSGPAGPTDIDGMSIAQLIGLLRSSDHGLRQEASIRLRRIGLAAVGPLTAALSDTDLNTSMEAAFALGFIGDQRAVRPLIAALEHENPRMRSRAALALARLHSSIAVPTLIQSLESDDVRVRQEATLGLRSWPDPRAIVPLIDALEDTDSFVRRTACMALSNFEDPSVVQPIVAFMYSEDALGRSLVSRNIAPKKDHRIVDVLVSFLSDADEDVRHSSAFKLAMIDTPYARDIVRALIDSDYSDPRHASAYVMGFIGDPGVEKRLGEIWNESPPDWVKVGIALGMVRFRNDQAALGFLRSAIRSNERDVPGEALLALERIGGKDSIEAIIALLKEGDQRIASNTIHALIQITGVDVGLKKEAWIQWYEKEWKLKAAGERPPGDPARKAPAAGEEEQAPGDGGRK
jgi:HEAT repeat protein